MAEDLATTIHNDILAYAEVTRRSVAAVDVGAKGSIDMFLDALEDDTPYIQAQLVHHGYALCGGQDQALVAIVARAVQMTHIYAMLARQGSYVQAAQGLHAAEIMLANADCDAVLRNKMVSITNRALLLYTHGLASSDQNTTTVLDCYATEAFLNPVHVGMVLAGAECNATDAITAFVMASGRAQIATSPKRAAASRKDALEVLPKVQAFWPNTDVQPLATLLVPGLA